MIRIHLSTGQTLTVDLSSEQFNAQVTEAAKGGNPFNRITFSNPDSTTKTIFLAHIVVAEETK